MFAIFVYFGNIFAGPYRGEWQPSKRNSETETRQCNTDQENQTRHDRQR